MKSAVRHPPSAVRFRVLQTPVQCKVRCSLLFKATLLLAGSASNSRFFCCRGGHGSKHAYMRTTKRPAKKQ